MHTEKLTPIEYQAAIFGMMLGDASASIRNKSGWMSITHSKQQLEYLLFKRAIIEQKISQKSRIHQRMTHLGDKIFEQYVMHTSQNKYGAFLRRVFYNNLGKRVIRKSMLRRLNDFSVFLWYLDDGYLNIRYDGTRVKEYRVFIYTQSFTYDDVVKLREFFEHKYSISPNINKKGNGYILYFNSAKTRKFMEIIEPYRELVPVMSYKFLKTHNLL